MPTLAAEKVLETCIDRVIPEELEGAALEAETKEQGTGVKLALERRKKWKNGRKLRIRFLDGDPAVQAKVAAVAKEWMKHANVNLEFGNDPKAEIRISFKQVGYWSAIGTDALVEEYFAKNQPTMNFQGFSKATPDSEYHRVVLHEFGHALGCIHEHQSPANGIKWNKEQIYRDLGGPPNKWDKATVDHNMFAKYAKDQTNYTAFDSKSIMLYSFPKTWTTDGMTFPTNTQLSGTDKEYIKKQYPK
jgi:hypothetical protein